LQQAKNNLTKFPDAIIIQCDWDTPKVYKNINTGKTWRYNGQKWRAAA
jgi:hypothetical protein